MSDRSERASWPVARRRETTGLTLFGVLGGVEGPQGERDHLDHHGGDSWLADLVTRAVGDAAWVGAWISGEAWRRTPAAHSLALEDMRHGVPRHAGVLKRWWPPMRFVQAAHGTMARAHFRDWIDADSAVLPATAVVAATAPVSAADARRLRRFTRLAAREPWLPAAATTLVHVLDGQAYFAARAHDVAQVEAALAAVAGAWDLATIDGDPDDAWPTPRPDPE